MAEEDNRRGDLNMVEEVPALAAVNGENHPADETTKGPQSVAGVSGPSTEDKTVENSTTEETKPTTPSSTRDSEETRSLLAKAREELNRAKEESARARDEVEKAKQELAEAKDLQDEQVPPEASKSAVEATSENPQPLTTPSTVSSSEEKKGDDQPCEPNQTVEAEGNVEKSHPSSKQEESQPLALVPETNQEAVKQEPETDTVVPKNPPKDEQVVTKTEKDADDADVEEGEASVDAADEEEVEEEGEEEEEEVVVEGEREEGDGEESGDNAGAAAQAKPLDDDEDKRNPQYIPKKGGFYEHDDRTREEGEEAPAEEPPAEEKPKKAMRSEAADRWGHDMFDPDQQGPKSNDELLTLYGYDIRQEEGAPRARRRRRYGRGPNKYDRTWEDEEAYSRPRGGGRGAPRGGSQSSRGAGGGGGPPESSRPRSSRQEAPKKEEFPPLSGQKEQPKDGESVGGGEAGQNSSASNWREGNMSNRRDQQQSNKGANAISFRRGGGGRTFEERNKAGSKAIKGRGDNQGSGTAEGDTGTESRPRDPNRPNRFPNASAEDDAGQGSHRSNRGRGGGTGRGSFQPRGRGMHSASQRGRGSGDNTWDGGNVTGRTGPGREEARGRGRGHGHGRQGGGGIGANNDQSGMVGRMEDMRIHDDQPTRSSQHQQDAVKSKRYSSQRQRMTTPPPATSSAATGGGNVQGQGPMSGQNPAYAAGNPAAAYYAAYNASPPPGYVPQPTALMAPHAPAAAYMAAPPIYPASPGQAAFSPGPYQPYPAAPAQPPPVQVGVPIGSPTQDNMYGGGIMYYDPGRQQPMHHHGGQPPRRAKAAIPIVAPDNDVSDSYVPTGRPAQS